MFSISLQCGIVGLPNVGKSTLFNALTKAGIPAENYPFCTIEPNVGVVEVPDPRMDAPTLPDAIAATEIALIRAALTRAQGNRTEAARALGISRQALYDRLRRYGLEMLSDPPTSSVGRSDDDAGSSMG